MLLASLWIAQKIPTHHCEVPMAHVTQRQDAANTLVNAVISEGYPPGWPLMQW
jgi:hypothetical protein